MINVTTKEVMIKLSGKNEKKYKIWINPNKSSNHLINLNIKLKFKV